MDPSSTQRDNIPIGLDTTPSPASDAACSIAKDRLQRHLMTPEVNLLTRVNEKALQLTALDQDRAERLIAMGFLKHLSHGMYERASQKIQTVSAARTALSKAKKIADLRSSTLSKGRCKITALRAALERQITEQHKIEKMLNYWQGRGGRFTGFARFVVGRLSGKTPALQELFTSAQSEILRNAKRITAGERALEILTLEQKKRAREIERSERLLRANEQLQTKLPAYAPSPLGYLAVPECGSKYLLFGLYQCNAAEPRSFEFQSAQLRRIEQGWQTLKQKPGNLRDGDGAVLSTPELSYVLWQSFLDPAEAREHVKRLFALLSERKEHSQRFNHEYAAAAAFSAGSQKDPKQVSEEVKALQASACSRGRCLWDQTGVVRAALAASIPTSATLDKISLWTGAAELMSSQSLPSSDICALILAASGEEREGLLMKMQLFYQHLITLHFDEETATECALIMAHSESPAVRTFDRFLKLRTTLQSTPESRIDNAHITALCAALPGDLNEQAGILAFCCWAIKNKEFPVYALRMQLSDYLGKDRAWPTANLVETIAAGVAKEALLALGSSAQRGRSLKAYEAYRTAAIRSLLACEAAVVYAEGERMRMAERSFENHQNYRQMEIEVGYFMQRESEFRAQQSFPKPNGMW